MSTPHIRPEDVKKVAKLANLLVSDEQTATFADQFSATISVIDELNELDTSVVPPTYQVNNLQNITREDLVDQSRVLPQEIALREAKNTHEGYIVVERIIDSSY